MTQEKSISPIPSKLYRNQLVTLGDLEEFKEDLLLSLVRIVQQHTNRGPKKWLKSKEVKSLLNISNGTLHSMRVNGTIPFTKIGNLIYYDQEEINAVLAGRARKNQNGVLPSRK